MHKLFLFYFVTLFIAFVNAKQAPEGCFRAAVLDHVQQTDPVHAFDHARNLELNLKIYEDAAAIAKQKDADIIVFPENGLIYLLTARSQADQFAENIPSLNNKLCTLDTKQAIQRLSCLAQKHEMFIAANLLDKRPCHDDEKSKCPEDGQFIFNTAVLFDRKGTLIGKYHKMHLFGEMALNVPPKPEIIVIDTELGRLGLQVCFDMIFNTPGHLLAKENKIDTMIFPTWWFDEAPFLASSQFQMAWAFGNNISLLASNIHRIELGSKGSGIYVGPTRQFVNSLYDDSVERLVLGNVPIQARSRFNCPLDPEVIQVPQHVPEQTNVKYHYQNLNLINTKLIELKMDNCQAESEPTVVNTCHEGVCCTVEYQRHFIAQQSTCNWMDYIPFLFKLINNRYFNNSPDEKEHYYLLVSNRTRPGAYHWSEEFCAIVHCPASNSKDDSTLTKECSQFRSQHDLKTLFRYVKLTGEFSLLATVYPSVVGSKHQLIHPDNNKWNFWQTNGSNIQQVVIELGSKQEANGNQLGTMALYGRIYERDPVYERKQVKINL